jgi:ABC-type dipeptide/oligopeptide/nickel transport system permease subunit
MAILTPEFGIVKEEDIMTNVTAKFSPDMETPPKVSSWQRFRRVFLGRGLVLFGIIIVLIFILVALFAPWIAPYPPNMNDLDHVREGPSMKHLLGTDTLGRDTLSRMIYGSRISLIIGISVVLSSCVIGMALGTIAGYYGGWVDIIIMRIIDSLMAFPMIILAMMIASLMGNGMFNLVVALGVGSISGFARVMYAIVLSAKESDYIIASRSLGATNARIMLRHVFPNSISPVIVMITMMLGGVILAEAAMSFLGIGIKPPTATWGNMIDDGRKYLMSSPILSFAPGIAIMLVVFSFNMVGDGLRDALDPRLRGAL